MNQAPREVLRRMFDAGVRAQIPGAVYRTPVHLVGDDVLVTNAEILKRGIGEGVGDSILNGGREVFPVLK